MTRRNLLTALHVPTSNNEVDKGGEGEGDPASTLLQDHNFALCVRNDAVGVVQWILVIRPLLSWSIKRGLITDMD